jgi:hypothetical protein
MEYLDNWWFVIWYSLCYLLPDIRASQQENDED